MKSFLATCAFMLAIDISFSAKAAARPVLENLAALAVSARWCKDYTVDLESALKISLGEKINPLKPPHEKAFDKEKEKIEALLADVGVSRFCSVTYDRFKPGGKVPGFMIKN